jgi:uncharacterized protein (DUF2384 family)
LAIRRSRHDLDVLVGAATDRMRTVAIVHLESDVSALPLDAARAGVLATRLAELMGVFDRPAAGRIDRRMVGLAIASAAQAGLAEQVAARPDAAEPGERTVLAFLEALRSSPRPAGEITRLARIFGFPGLAGLVGASEPSLRRYAAATRPAPDPVAERVHFLAQLVAILRGSFNEFGIRRWFERPHPALENRAPRLLVRADPAESGPQATLAAALQLLA